jgi:hypothetical protein
MAFHLRRAAASVDEWNARRIAGASAAERQRPAARQQELL